MEQAHKKKAEMLAWFREYKQSLSCSRCEESDWRCLDFHHTDRTTKDMVVSGTVRLGWSTDRIKSEIEKCEVLCANCHRKEHAPVSPDGSNVLKG